MSVSDASEVKEDKSLLEQLSSGDLLQRFVEEARDPVADLLDQVPHSGTCRKTARDEQRTLSCKVCLAEDHYEDLRQDVEMLSEELEERWAEFVNRRHHADNHIEQLTATLGERDQLLAKWKTASGIIGLLLFWAVFGDKCGPQESY